MYFSLKDAGAQVRCALFHGSRRLLGFEPRDGLHVLARARVSLYEGRGDFNSSSNILKKPAKACCDVRSKYSSNVWRRKACSSRRVKTVAAAAKAHRPYHLALRRRAARYRDHAATAFPGDRRAAVPGAGTGRRRGEKIAAAIRLAGERKDCDA